jgi:hypothetical protein
MTVGVTMTSFPRSLHGNFSNFSVHLPKGASMTTSSAGKVVALSAIEPSREMVEAARLANISMATHAVLLSPAGTNVSSPGARVQLPLSQVDAPHPIHGCNFVPRPGGMRRLVSARVLPSVSRAVLFCQPRHHGPLILAGNLSHKLLPNVSSKHETDTRL